MDGGQRSAEHLRLQEAREDNVPWRKWGPYLSERQWGTVREDYSENGDAWDYFAHDQARSRAYRWGEDGLAGICDHHQILCFALALWNGRDPILKERLFGLTNSEGNHGEDVKEYYFYLDSTPTHSYMKYLYKYALAAYPYANLVETNRRRSRGEMEYELIDTGIFDGDRYFDVVVEYAKATPEDVLPTLWFRNTWSWPDGGSKPMLQSVEAAGQRIIQAHHTDPLFQESLDDYYLYGQGTVPWLFTENETNTARLFGTANQGLYVKDGISNAIVHRQQDAVNPAQQGTKASPHYHLTIDAGSTQVVRLRLTRTAPGQMGDPFRQFDAVVQARRGEADEFYRALTPPSASADSANVMRQAFAGMLWSKQYYYFNADTWLEDHRAHPLHPASRVFRNRDWFHMINDDIISMPDKWEYPWYAAWDLAFHTIALSIVDPDFAKQQLDLMLTGLYLHPNGQIPAYEWNFSDVNPPVHAWATIFLTRTEEALRGEVDLAFLKSTFHKLLLNFTWWVNRKDRFGKNVFEGGFLGLDNIGVFDRSAPLPTGGYLEQADGTAWMALFTQNMGELAVELAAHDPTYETLVEKFLDHFLWIAAGMNRPGEDGRLRRVLSKMLDKREFFSPYGIRSLSKFHQRHPYVFHVGSQEYRVDYLPAESDSGIFGGNSNWRGPIWFPVNVLIIRALLSFYLYYGDNFTIECPTGSGRLMNLFEVAKEIADRLTGIFLQDERGRRPVYGGTEKFQSGPHWRDHLSFYEYFHGDNGAGLGASHQTGWTGLVGALIHIFGLLDPKRLLEEGRKAVFDHGEVKK